MENKDDKCFLWSVLRDLHPRETHSTKINDLRKYENDLNFKGIEFPVKVKIFISLKIRILIFQE